MDDLVRHKKMIFTIDTADKMRDVIRKVIIDFFKNLIGFTNDDIIFIDRNEFGEDKNGLDQTKFSDKKTCKDEYQTFIGSRKDPI